MIHNDYGHQVYEEEDLISVILSGQSIDGLDAINCDKFIASSEEFSQDPGIKKYVEPSMALDVYHCSRTAHWNIPEEYKNLDIISRIQHKITNEEQAIRVAHEYSIMEQINCLPFIRAVVYIIDSLREKNIVWGVGRGSSVSSYILFLLGVHSVDSLKYKLPFDEFIK